MTFFALDQISYVHSKTTEQASYQNVEHIFLLIDIPNNDYIIQIIQNIHLDSILS